MCYEVSMRSCFWLTAVIATQQEQLPSLSVDPTCILKLAWCAYMGDKTFAWCVAFVLWLPPLWESREHLSCTWSATTVGISRTFVVHMEQMPYVLF